MNENQGETVNKMNPEVKAKWVAALRSGEYKQGKDCLRRGDAFCCLGVLCDIKNPGGWGLKYGDRFQMDGRDELPPKFVGEWAGFEIYLSGYYCQTPTVEIYGDLLTLDSHNDNGRTFSEIADAIEAQL